MVPQPYERLKIWKIAMHLLERVYRRTAFFPEEEKSAMIPMLRKSAAAIPGRIADGALEDDAACASRFFQTASTALRDLETNLLLCKRLHLIKAWELRPLRKRCRQIESLLEAEMNACQAELEPMPLGLAA